MLGDPSLYTTPVLNAACFGSMSVDVLGDPLLCFPLHCSWGKYCPFWCDGRELLVQLFTVLPPLTLHLC